MSIIISKPSLIFFSSFLLFAGFAKAAHAYPCQAQYEACLAACPSLACQDKCADDWLFHCPEEKPACAQKTSCQPQYCQYGGDLQKCTVTDTDCSTSSYATGACNPEPAPPPPVVAPTQKSAPKKVAPPPPPAPQSPEGQCASWRKSGQERYRGDEVTVLTDVASVECEVRTRVGLQAGPRQDVIENRYRYFYEGKQFCKEIVRFTNSIESARGKDCSAVPAATETRRLEFGKDVNAGDIVVLRENTRYILQMPNGRVFVKETPQKEGEAPLGAMAITATGRTVEMSLEDGFYYFLFKKTLQAFAGEGEGTLEPLIFTRLAALRLKGTEFLVNVTPSGITSVQVFDGSVGVTNRTTGETVDITSGQGAVIVKDKPLALARPEKGEYEEWWKDFPEYAAASLEASREEPRPSKAPFGPAAILVFLIVAAGAALIWHFRRKIKK